jgi:hypothetical protein
VKGNIHLSTRKLKVFTTRDEAALAIFWLVDGAAPSATL